jgi:hypothetical protein
MYQVPADLLAKWAEASRSAWLALKPIGGFCCKSFKTKVLGGFC